MPLQNFSEGAFFYARIYLFISIAPEGAAKLKQKYSKPNSSRKTAYYKHTCGGVTHESCCDDKHAKPRTMTELRDYWRGSNLLASAEEHLVPFIYIFYYFHFYLKIELNLFL